jgi:hypothetical protein
VVGDDVAPTSLNEGRGEVVVPAFEVSVPPGTEAEAPSGKWMGRWWR